MEMPGMDGLQILTILRSEYKDIKVFIFTSHGIQYRKKAEKIVGGWKVYDEQGTGGATDYIDPAPVAEMAMRAKNALGADIIGFDCIYSTEKQSYLIVDENTLPGMYEHCFAQAGKGSWAEMFFSFLMIHVR